MQLSIHIKDESKVDFLLELFRELRFVEVLTSANGHANGAAALEKPRRKKLNPDQQEFVDDLKESLELVELHLQGKIKLQSAQEFLAEL